MVSQSQSLLGRRNLAFISRFWVNLGKFYTPLSRLWGHSDRGTEESLSGTSPVALSSPLQILERGGGEVSGHAGRSQNADRASRPCTPFAQAAGPTPLARP